MTDWAALSLKDMTRMKRDILRFLLLRGRLQGEGSASPEELLYLASAVQRSGARRVAEIGFHAGFSSHAFLSADPDTRVVSFDLGEHRCTKVAKRLIDTRFPTRHTLIYGDSRTTVPGFKAGNPAARFDLVFIDGGHDYEVAKADIINMKPLCTQEAVVIMDDLVPWMSYGEGPTQAWGEAIREGIVRQEELVQDGRKRSWALGRYVL